MQDDPDDSHDGDEHVVAIASTRPVTPRGQCDHLHYHLKNRTRHTVRVKGQVLGK